MILGYGMSECPVLGLGVGRAGEGKRVGMVFVAHLFLMQNFHMISCI